MGQAEEANRPTAGDASPLLARAETSQEELALLYSLADAFNRADSLEQIYAAALDAVLRALAVERASILVFDAARVMRFRAWRGLSEAYRRAVDGHSPWGPDAQDPAPVLIS